MKLAVYINRVFFEIGEVSEVPLCVDIFEGFPRKSQKVIKGFFFEGVKVKIIFVIQI